MNKEIYSTKNNKMSRFILNQECSYTIKKVSVREIDKEMPEGVIVAYYLNKGKGRIN